MRIRVFFILISFSGLAIAQSNDENIQQRIDSLKLNIETQYNEDVRSAVYELIGNFGGKTSKAISQYLIHKEELDSIFITNNTPQEFALAALSLTYFNPFFDDETGCEGPFKMRYNVAKSGGLHISNYVDERRDLLKSAEAFCKELNQIYFKADDWKTAYTVYCSGIIEWQKAKLNSADMENDFWLINSFLPTVYKAAYPKLIAANYIAKYYWVHGIEVDVNQSETKEVVIEKYTTLYQLATKLEMDYDLLKKLNPIYKKDIVPESLRQYRVVLPKEKADLFAELGEEVYNYEKPEEVVNPEQVVLEPVGSDKDPEVKEEIEEPAKPVTKQLVYRVKKGDYLGLIADIYDCRISDIRRWNSLRSTRIDVNQRLVIIKNQENYDKYKNVNSLTMAQKKSLAAKD